MTQKPHIHWARRSLRLVAAGSAVAAIAVGAAACNDSSGSSLPEGVAARVGDTPITFTQLNRVMTQSAATAKAQGQTFPATGSTEYKDAQRQALQTLVNVQVVRSEVKVCGSPCAVTPKDVDKELDSIVKAQFQGKQAELTKFLKSRQLSMAEARDQVRASLQQSKIREHVTRGVRFNDADARKYYLANTASFRVPAERVASHILVKTKAEADKLYAEATPANFAELAKKHSQDPGSKGTGGSLGPIQKGALVPEFEKVAFALPQGQISKPVKTQFGYHLILITKITKPRTIPFAEAKKQIVSQQLQTERQTTFQTWVDKTLKKWKDRTVYANKDLEPVETPAAQPGADGQPQPQPATP